MIPAAQVILVTIAGLLGAGALFFVCSLVRPDPFEFRRTLWVAPEGKPESAAPTQGTLGETPGPKPVAHKSGSLQPEDAERGE